MRKYLFAITLVATLLGLTGCASMNAQMESWKGHQVDELVATWGQPEHVIDLGNGNQEFVWSSTRSWTTPATATPTSFGSPTIGNTPYGNAYSTTIDPTPQTTSYTATRSFWVHANGEIYGWAWHGL